MKLPPAKQRSLDELLEKNKESTITPALKRRLNTLVVEAEQLMVSNAKRLAAFRGAKQWICRTMIDLLEENRDAMESIGRKYGVRRLKVFGTAAIADNYDPGRSDVDFLVEFQPDQDLGPWLKQYFDFTSNLKRLLGRPIDVVMASVL